MTSGGNLFRLWGEYRCEINFKFGKYSHGYPIGRTECLRTTIFSFSSKGIDLYR